MSRICAACIDVSSIQVAGCGSKSNSRIRSGVGALPDTWYCRVMPFPPSNAPRGQPFRSKLVPFHHDIARWQREGLTYRQLAERLAKEHGINAAISTIRSFVMVRFRRKRRPMLPIESFSAGCARKPVSDSNSVALQLQVPHEGSSIIPAAATPRPIVPSTFLAASLSTKRKLLDHAGKEVRCAEYPPTNPDEL